jgi:hypothetical protein
MYKNDTPKALLEAALAIEMELLFWLTDSQIYRHD